MEEELKSAAVGIDLGTSKSCAAISQDGRSADVILDDEGNRTTPSCVTFTSYHHFTGDPAFNLAFSNPLNTVFDAKRLIGRKFDDEVVQKDLRLWPCKVVASPGCGISKRPMFLVTYKNEQKKFAAEEISAMVLMKMKVAAEAYLDSVVKDVVVTVPAYFNNMQRQATKDAAIIAGFSGVRMINETTAAAIAYGLDKKFDGSSVASRNVLVYDLGGGTLDVALVTIQKDVFEVKSVNGNTHLGGRDFDFRMVRHFVAEFERKHGKDISHNPRAMVRLRAACEKAKKNLSSTPFATIEIDCLLEGIDFSSSITRARFESLNMDLFEECINLVRKCLEDAKMEKDDVHDVVLIGGSSRIPKVQLLLKEFFRGMELHRSINPDEAVACGAAIYAANLSCFHNKHDDNKHIRVVDVTPLSIGVRVHSGIMAAVFDRNTPVPTRREKIYTTSRDFRTKASICVHESEILEALDDNLVGKFKLSGIPRTRKRVPRIKISFEIDADRILKSSAEELMRGNKKGIIISYQSGRLSMEEVERMVNDAKKYKVADEQYKEKLKAMNALERSAEHMRTLLKRHGTKIGPKERRKMGDAIDQTIQWLDQNFFLAEGGMFEDKMKELEIICEPFTAKMFDSHNSSPCSTGTTTKFEIINLDLS